MLHSKTNPTANLHNRLPNTPVSPVRHGRLFELLRHDTSVETSGEHPPELTPRDEFKLSDDDMMAIQSASIQTLQPRKF